MKKYQFTDAEYKEFVEALGGKKKPLDVENAKIVRITYDEISGGIYHDEEDDDMEAHVSVGSKQTIREVIDTPDTPSDFPGETGYVTIRTENGEEHVPKSFTLRPTCTIINTAELKSLAYLMTTSHPYRSVGPAPLEIRINDIEVLATRE